MRRLIVFNSVTLDGYFTGADGDLRWAHSGEPDPEFDAFVEQNASGGGELLFGRITYEMMSAHWTTEQARKDSPIVAEGMNRMPKVVFSKSMDKATWNNTRVLKGDLEAEVRKLKNERGAGLAIMGSGSIVRQLAPTRLIDEYQLVVTPVVLGKGRALFEGIPEMQHLKLTRSRTFRNGKVFLCYAPAAWKA